MKLEDFGDKIGGAKKDLWKARGLLTDDLLSMNDREKLAYVKKDNIWKKPDYEAIVASGVPKRVAYFIKRARDALPAKPPIHYTDNVDEVMKNYINFVSDFRQQLMSMKTENEAYRFYRDFVAPRYLVDPSARYVVSFKSEVSRFASNKLLKAITGNEKYFWYKIDSEISKTQFCYTEKEKMLHGYTFLFYDNNRVKFERDYYGRSQLVVSDFSSKRFFYPEEKFTDISQFQENRWIVLRAGKIIEINFLTKEDAENFILEIEKNRQGDQKQQEKAKHRKRKFVPPQLENIKRTGMNYRYGRNISGNDYLQIFEFKGGEFGNWMNEKDRQYSMNYGYDALLDLSRVLHVDPKDIALDHTLSIAFGARGSGNALAHYEPMRHVINLTKMKGAGSLAHEWGHALDDFIGLKLGLPSYGDGAFASARISDPKIVMDLPAMDKLVRTMKYTTMRLGASNARTDFYKDALLFDREFSKTGHGYWASDIEMFARCFACYVYDKLGEERSDYLAGHANLGFSVITLKDNTTQKIYAYPRGEERERINACFDELIKELKDKEILHDYEYELPKENNSVEKAMASDDFKVYFDSEGQPCLFDFEEEIER